MHTLLWPLVSIFLFIVPGAAIFPAFLYSSRLAVTIPIISVFILYAIKEGLAYFSIYSTANLYAILIFFTLLAIYRARQCKSTVVFDWPAAHRFFYITNLLVLIPAAIHLWTTIYQSDELFSWSYWAAGHFHGERPDFSWTGAPYPQIFSVTIANIYKITGSADFHYLARSLMIIFPWTFLSIIAITALDTSKSFVKPSILILITLSFFYEYFASSFAEQIMVPALIASIYLTREYLSNDRKDILIASGICATTAILTKHQSIPWPLFCYPVLIIHYLENTNHKKTAIFMALFPLICSATWYLLEGRGITQNESAIAMSIGEKDIFDHLISSIKHFSLLYPNFIILVIAAYLFSKKTPFNRLLWFGLIAPGIVFWITLGTYGALRLCLNVIAVLLLMIAYENTEVARLKHTFNKNLFVKLEKVNLKKYLCLVIITFAVALEVSTHFRASVDEEGHKNTLRWKYENNIEEAIALYDNPDARLWTSSITVVAMFYKHAYLIRPNSDATPLDILEQIKREKPDYIDIPFWKDHTMVGLYSSFIFNEKCPDLTTPYVDSYSGSIKKMDMSKIDACIHTLQQYRINEFGGLSPK